MGAEVVYAADAGYDAIQCCWNHQRRRIGKVLLSSYAETMNLRIECPLHLGCSSAEYNCVSAAPDTQHRESLRFEPPSDSVDISLAEAKIVGILRGREPPVKG